MLRFPKLRHKAELLVKTLTHNLFCTLRIKVRTHDQICCPISVVILIAG